MSIYTGSLFQVPTACTTQWDRVPGRKKLALGAKAGTEASRLTLVGAPACEPGGVGESDHSDSSCLVSSSTLAAAVSSSICFRSMCFMARAVQEGVAVRTWVSLQRPASIREGPSGASPAPYPSSHWKFRSRRSLVLWNASLSMVPAEAGRLRRRV